MAAERIKKLEKLADEAYKRRDFTTEDKYDTEAKALREQLEKQSPPVKPLTVENLVPHKWDEEEVKRFGDARCQVCGQKKSYYTEGVAHLMAWSEDEKRNQRFNVTLMSFSCKKRD